MFENNPLNQFVRQYASQLRLKDEPPKTLDEWTRLRESLRQKIFNSIGPFPSTPCDLNPQMLGVLNRDGYRIEKWIIQTRPDVWITANTYVPALEKNEKVPGILVVHGHWPWARRDPVVQSRCLGLVKLGFFVLAVDAFGAGERYPKPAQATYHGALYGSSLWPVGHTLLGMQVYDNRRAVDYLLSRPEVNSKLGITGASGGGNQTMYAGALDERIHAVVPVCSVGNYQSYLRTACCVCEVLPDALKFTEEGAVLGLVAPRALLVINATKDGIQFSPTEAEKSVFRAKSIFKLLSVEDKIKHSIFESSHDYNQSMREAMYGWMTLHLKGVGKGEPIAEPKLTLEKVEDLACFFDPNDRPKNFLVPHTFAFEVGKSLVQTSNRLRPTHREEWESTAIRLRDELAKHLGPIPKVPHESNKPIRLQKVNSTLRNTIPSEGPLTLPIEIISSNIQDPLAIVLHLNGRSEAQKHPIFTNFVQHRYQLLTTDLRGTGETKMKGDAIAGAPDHNSAEHGVWIGRPMLNQWITDCQSILDWLDSGIFEKRPLISLVGIGHAGVVAMLVGALYPDRIASVTMIGSLTSWISENPYATGMPMSILFPGILKVGDIPHLASLIAARKLTVIDGINAAGKKLIQRELEAAFAFTQQVYDASKASDRLSIQSNIKWSDVKLR